MAKTESKPRFILDATNHEDKSSAFQPSKYLYNLKASVPLLHPYPWNALGSLNRRTKNDAKTSVDDFVYISSRRINLINPIPSRFPNQIDHDVVNASGHHLRSHSEMFSSKVFRPEFNSKNSCLDKSSKHLYKGKYRKPKRTFAGSSVADKRSEWCAKRVPGNINNQAQSGAAAWDVLRPLHTRSIAQMGYHYIHRISYFFV